MKKNLTYENGTLCKKHSQFLEGIRLSIDNMMLLDCGHSWEGTLAAIVVCNAIHVQIFSLHTFNLTQTQLYILPINSNLQKCTDYSSSSLSFFDFIFLANPFITGNNQPLSSIIISYVFLLLMNYKPSMT